MISCTINGARHTFPYQEQLLPVTDPLDWLESLSLYPKFYWQEKGSPIKRAAVGSLLSFEQVPLIEGDSRIHIYGGGAFQQATKGDITWDHFPRSYFFLPTFELISDLNHSILRSYVSTPLLREQTNNNTPHSPLAISCTPNRLEWEEICRECGELFEGQALHKVVLARKTRLMFQEPPSPFASIASNPLTTSFLFQMTPQAAFVGATPELLFRKEGVLLEAEAIAGTRKRSGCQEEKATLEQELLTGKKEQREFQLVKQGLTELLLPLTERLEWLQQDSIVKTPSVQHLYNRLTATLLPSICDHQLLQTLHPTAALGGFPKEKALAALHRLEPFDRGWYGAPIGILSSKRSTFYVGIRSALFRENRVDLFTGVGLVKGSDPAQEWEELNAKLGWFDSCLPQAIHESCLLLQ